MNKKLLNLFYFLLLLSVLLLSIIFIFDYTIEKIILIILLSMTILLFFQLSVIKKNSYYTSVLADGRTYFFLFIYIYSIWVPMMSLLSNISSFGFSPLNIYGSSIYSIEDMLRSTILSLVMILGFTVGLLVSRKLYIVKSCQMQSTQFNILNFKKMRKYWGIILLISTYIYILPFIMGGFKTINRGGSILDVNGFSEIFGNNLIMSFVGFLFSPEIMTISTIAYLYYLINDENFNNSKKFFIISSLIALHSILTLTTTRSARFVIILIALFAIIKSNFNKEKVKVLNVTANFIPVIISLIYFIDFFFVDNLLNSTKNAQSILVELMRRFDGIGPYDAYLKAINTIPNIGMLSNILYSLIIPIPVIGSIVVSFFGMSSTSPMYNWMANNYPAIYNSGGGLAYMPQIEMYLIGGTIGTFILALLLGLVFGKPRQFLLNFILIAFGLMFARGNIGIIATLFTPYILISYLLYEKTFSKISQKVR